MPSEPVQGQQALPSGSRRLDIQGLRAVAVILVVAFHAGLPVSGGFIGVDVFLVISGFVIMGMLMRELQATGTIRFRTFYTRRIKRLLPALALLTTVVAVASVFLGSSFGSQQTTARTGLGATYFSANVVIYRDSIGYFTPEASTNPLLHTWTLSVEEQVYLVFPALLLGSWFIFLRRKARPSELHPRSRYGRRSLQASRWGAAIMLAAVAVLSFLYCLLASFGDLSSPPRFAFYSSLTRIWEFAIGAGLALAAPKIKGISPNIAVPLGAAGALAIAVGALAITDQTPYPGIAVLLPVLGAAAIITSGFRPYAVVPRLLAKKPMAKIGDLSYAWYLWHWPMIVFGAILWPGSRWVLVGLGAISFIPAWASTVFLEDPIRRSRAIKGRRVLVLAASCTIIPTLAFVGLAAGARTSWGNEEVAQMQTQVGAVHAAAKNHCDDAATASSIDESGCQWNASPNGSQNGPHVYLVGNSVAAMYSEALIGATRTIDIPLTIDTSHGCFSEGQSDDRDCSDNFDNTINRLIQRQPGVVVMSSTWDLGLYGGDADVDPATKTSNREKVQFLISSLTQAIMRLRGAGDEVVIVLPTPRFFHTSTPGKYAAYPDPFLPRQDAHSSLWRTTDCSSLVAQSDPSACGATVPKAEEDAAQERTLEALKQVAETTGSVTLDLRDRFCPAGVCRTNIGDRWMFEDGVHITVDESEALAPTFASLLREIIGKSGSTAASVPPSHNAL